MRKRLASIALAGVLALGLAACAEGSTAPQAAAGDPTDLAEIERLALEEGKVVWYTGALPPTSDALIAGFEKAYPGIKVEFPGRMSSAEMGTRIQNDVRNTGVAGADFIGPQPDAALTLYMRDENITRPVSVDSFEGLRKEFGIGEDAGVVCQVQVPVIGYNTALLGDFAPSSWKDLLDPRLKGQIMVADPRGTVTWQRVWAALLNDPDLGKAFVEKIVAQDFQPVANSLVATEQLIAGQGALQIAGIPSLFEPAMARGQNVKFWVPKDPAPVSPNGCALAEGTENPNAGFLFMHYLLSKEGQSILNGVERSASPLGNIPDAFPLPEDAVYPDSPARPDELETISDMLGFN